MWPECFPIYFLKFVGIAEVVAQFENVLFNIICQSFCDGTLLKIFASFHIMFQKKSYSFFFFLQLLLCLQFVSFHILTHCKSNEFGEQSLWELPQVKCIPRQRGLLSLSYLFLFWPHFQEVTSCKLYCDHIFCSFELTHYFLSCSDGMQN